jgi:hypothetical protein
MSIAEEVVSVVFAAIAGGVALTEADREKAEAAVRAKLAEVKAIDPGPLKPKADAVRAKHLASIGMRDLTDAEIDHELHVDVLRGLEARGAVLVREAEAIRYAVRVLSPERRSNGG